jgi:hypothetical protein
MSKGWSDRRIAIEELLAPSTLLDVALGEGQLACRGARARNPASTLVDVVKGNTVK